MGRRAVALFWTAVTASVFLLGGSVATVRALADGGGPVSAVLLGVSCLGLVASLFVAGRIVVVTGRSTRAR